MMATHSPEVTGGRVFGFEPYWFPGPWPTCIHVTFAFCAQPIGKFGLRDWDNPIRPTVHVVSYDGGRKLRKFRTFSPYTQGRDERNV